MASSSNARSSSKNHPHFAVHSGTQNSSSPSSPNEHSLPKGVPDYICLGSGCFVCERAALQSAPENANWKKKVQKSIVAYQMKHPSNVEKMENQNSMETNHHHHHHKGGSFNVETIKQLKPADSDKTKPFYIYDEKLGRKRRHDPWFAKHKVTKSASQSMIDSQEKNVDMKRRKIKQEFSPSSNRFRPHLSKELSFLQFQQQQMYQQQLQQQLQHQPYFSHCKQEPVQGVPPPSFLQNSANFGNNNSNCNTWNSGIQVNQQQQHDTQNCVPVPIHNPNSNQASIPNPSTDLFISNLMPYLSLNNMDFFPNLNNNSNPSVEVKEEECSSPTSSSPSPSPSSSSSTETSPMSTSTFVDLNVVPEEVDVSTLIFNGNGLANGIHGFDENSYDWIMGVLAE